MKLSENGLESAHKGKTQSLHCFWAILFLSSPSLAYPQESKRQDQTLHSLDCTIVDEAGIPVSGALIYDCPHYHRLTDPSQPKVEPLATTDRLGHFQLRRKSDDLALAVFVVAEGKVVDLLSGVQIGHRPLQVRLKDESKIEVIVYDENGKPIQGARVAPSVLDFRASFWSNFISSSVEERLQTITDATGRTLLRGADFKGLESVQVDLGNGAKRNFELPRNWDRNSPIVLTWNPFRGSLRCRILDHRNRPVPNAPVTVSSLPEKANSLVITQPTISFMQSARTDDQGECFFSEVPVTQVDLTCTYSDHHGISIKSEMVSIRRNEISKVELKLPPTKNVAFSVLDLSEFQEHAGIFVVFRKKQEPGYVFARGITDEEGRGRVTLEVGKWDDEVQHLQTLPKGYHLAGPVETQQIVVAEDAEPKPVPPILISKGRTIEGKISGVDFAELRADWIIVNIADPKGTEREYWGTYQLNGDFQVTLPKDTSDDQIASFQISHSPVTNRRKLTVVSKSPWRLEWEAEKQKEDPE